MADFPTVSASLVEALERIYPNKLPIKTTNEVEMSRLQGRQDVINFLAIELENQASNSKVAVVNGDRFTNLFPSG
jgi:hypothetical protein